MLTISTLLEFLRLPCANCVDKYDIDSLKQKLKWLNESKKANIDILMLKYWDLLDNIISKIFVNRSKYHYIESGIDFLHHIRTRSRIPEELYDIIARLVAVEQMITEINHELINRIKYTELDFDSTAIPVYNIHIGVAKHQAAKILKNNTRKKVKQRVDVNDVNAVDAVDAVNAVNIDFF